jgi:very-short-patch-repair endonuclease
MRRLFTAAESGLTNSALRWGCRTGRCVRVQQAVYAEGSEPATAMDRARAKVLASGSPARGALAGVLLGLDAVELDDKPTRRDTPPHCLTSIVQETPCADALTTLLDLARFLDDDRWEQALESALRKRLVRVGEVAIAGRSIPRIVRVVARRPVGAAPTESLMETLMVQLARPIPLLGELVRQHEVHTPNGAFIARLDLCRPEIGLFLELDGQQHADQPVYDARRETAVVAATGMLPGRFTWHEVTRIPRSTQRRLGDLAIQAQLRWRRAS